MTPKKSTPPPRRVGRGGGRQVSQETIDAMRVVANHPDEWFQVSAYKTAGSASSAAHRMRRRDWDEVLGIDGTVVWDFVSRTFEDGEGAGVWAKRRTSSAHATV
jgi:hypothetical protein